MGEIKSVKVDNWGVFFLQKLQNFFNKTDYCDLTLQFNDNSQLKVHKLVLSACTDYFNVLEQTCEMIDDILIMPNELQADLVVPIVNFMYTGTLEFELKMYGKLLKTARDMNMTVLLKLLEAHRRTMEGGPKQVIRNNTKTSPRTTCLNTGTKTPAINPTARKVVERHILSPSSAKNRITATTNVEPFRKLQIKPISTTFSTVSGTNTMYTKYPQSTRKGPTRFEYEGDNVLPESYDSSFDNISYESKPLKEDLEDDDSGQHQKVTIAKQESTTSSPFEQLRRTGYNNKRPAQSILQSPPTKKPNIQDVKEYAEQQRMRKQIAEEYGEDFDDTLDDDFHNADDDEEYMIPSRQTVNKSSNKQYSPSKNASSSSSSNKQEQKPTIVVKDSTSSNVDHAKIISEVLRKYPHLIKNNKNIKLKIMPNSSGTGGPQKVVIKKESNIIQMPSTSKIVSSNVQETKILKPQPKTVSPQTKSLPTPPINTNQPRRIDSKTMKALIALGAENTTGPWLCLRCGVNGRPISIPSYRGFRRHLINTHKEKIDARLCEHCGWRSITHKELLFHMEMEHQIKSNINFPKCEYCSHIVLDLVALEDHMDEHHPEKKEENQMCIYCNKTFSTEILLYNHMKAQHKDRAREDGVIDFSDDEHIGEFEDDEEMDESYEPSKITHQQPSTSKIQILSDINLPKCISLTQMNKATEDKNSESGTAEALNIATSLGLVDGVQINSSPSLNIEDGPKFVNAEGNVMELTAAQRDEIISQLEQGGDGLVMVLNDESFVAPKTNEAEVEGSEPTTTDNQLIGTQLESNNMMIVYDQEQADPTTAENNKDTIDSSKKINNDSLDEVDSEVETQEKIMDLEKNKETVENKIKEENKNESSKKEDTTEDLDMKLKLLTGDWTEDEDEENDTEKPIKKEKIDEDITSPNNSKILDILTKSNDSEIEPGNISEKETISSEKLTEDEVISKDDSKNKEIHSEEVDSEKKVASNLEDKEKILFSDEITLQYKSEEITEEITEEKKDIDDKFEFHDEEESNIKNYKENDRKDIKKIADIKEENFEKLPIENTTDLNECDDIEKTLENLHAEKPATITDTVENLKSEEDNEKSGKSNEISTSIIEEESEKNEEIDDVSKNKAKNEIKSLISEWGEEDDDV